MSRKENIPGRSVASPLAMKPITPSTEPHWPQFIRAAEAQRFQLGTLLPHTHKGLCMGTQKQ